MNTFQCLKASLSTEDTASALAPGTSAGLTVLAALWTPHLSPAFTSEAEFRLLFARRPSLIQLASAKEHSSTGKAVVQPAETMRREAEPLSTHNASVHVRAHISAPAGTMCACELQEVIRRRYRPAARCDGDVRHPAATHANRSDVQRSAFVRRTLEQRAARKPAAGREEATRRGRKREEAVGGWRVGGLCNRL